MAELFPGDGFGSSSSDPVTLAVMNDSAPVLWISGNRGDWTQVFPISSWTNQYLGQDSTNKRQLRVFSLDFNAWPSAFHGDFVENEVSEFELLT